jgi:hypothetical protein
MKRLIPSLALLLVVLLAPHVKADGAGLALQEAWNAQQTQQERIAGEFSRIETDAARALNGTSVPVKQRALTCQPSAKAQVCMCASPENSKW